MSADPTLPAAGSPLTRRGLLAALLGLAAGGAGVIAAASPAEARRRWGAPPGWSRGRKRGWRKRGGPKWRW
jgi:hypothetical protein